MNPERLHLLIAEDEAAHIEAIRRAFDVAGVNVEIQSVGTLREFRACMLERPPDLALIDLNLPDGRAVEVLTHPPEDAPFPILVMTAFGNQQIVVEVMKAGALDYVVKSPEAFATMPRTAEKALREWELLQKHKWAQDKLQESEEKYRLLVENAKEAVYVVQHGKVVFANAMFAQLAELDEPAVIGASTEEFVAPEDRPRIRDHHRRLIGGEKFEGPLEVQVRTRKGSVLWVSINAVKIDWQGHPATLNFAIDITDRKRSEEARSKVSAHQEAILATIPDIIMEVNNDKVYTWANHAGLEFFGNDVVGRKAQDFFEGEQDTLATVQPLFNGNEQVIYLESWQRRQDGQKRLLAWWCHTLKDSQGQVTGALSTARDITVQKQAEAMLAKSEAEYRRLFENSLMGISEATPDGHLIRANTAYAKMYGYGSPERMLTAISSIGHQLYAHPEERLEVLRILGEKGYMAPRAVEVVRRDGSRFWVMASAREIRDPSGQLLCYQAAHVDITARKQTEIALHQANTRLALAQQAAKTGMWEWDMPANILNWTPEFFRLFGLDPATAKADFATWRGTLHPEDLATAEKQISESIRDRRPLENEYRIVLPSGENRWIFAAGDTTYAADGTPLRMAGICVDITARKQTEAALRESEQRHRDYLAHSPHGIFVADEKGRLVQVNPAACRITGYSEMELLSMSVPDLHGEDGRQDATRHFQAVVREGQASGELQFRTKTGEPRWWLVSAVKISATRFLGFCNDITARKQAEEALRASQQITESIIDSIPMRVFWKDRNLVFLGCNRAFARDAGFMEPKDLVGKDDFQMGWRAQAELYRADDRQVIRSGKPKLFIEEPQTTPDGKTLTLLTSKIPLRDAQGEISGVLGTYMDITEHKQAEEQLRATELRLREIAANIPGVVYQLAINRKGSYEVPYMSDGCETLFGRAVTGMDYAALWFDQMPPEDLAALRQTLADAAKRVEQWTLEFRIVLPDGQTKWLRGSANPQKLPAGGILWNGVLLDITERKLSEDLATQEQALNKAIIESIPGTFYMLDETGKYVRWSAYQRDEIVGKPDDQVARTNALDTIHPDDRALIQSRIANVLQTGVEETVEGRVLLRGGPKFQWLLMTGRQLVVAGHPFLVGIGIDITRRKQAEAQMAQQLDELRRWQTVTLGREGRVAELKREVNALAARLGQPPPYPSVEEK
jgi:PAS domain S-box-containing protein